MKDLTTKPTAEEKDKKPTDEELQEFFKSLNEEDLAEVNSRVEALKGKGKSEEEAKIEAAKSFLVDEALWKEATKRIGVTDFLDDQIRRALIQFKKSYAKHMPDDPIDFKFHLRKNRAPGGSIGSVSLVIEMKRKGLYQAIREKSITFRHVREMRDEHAWKMALYESLFCDIVELAMLQVIYIDKVRNKEFDEIPAPKPTTETETPDSINDGSEIRSGVGGES